MCVECVYALRAKSRDKERSSSRVFDLSYSRTMRWLRKMCVVLGLR